MISPVAFRLAYRLMVLGCLLYSLPLAADEPLLLDWDDLVPEGWPPEELFADINFDELEDSDPEAEALFAKLEKVWDDAPMVEQLDGQRVYIPGHAIPLDGDGREQVTTFLLVPYFGACIHVPPPPRNQTILVTMQGDRKARIRHAFDLVWVTGTLRVKVSETELALTGYTIEGEVVAPYEDSL